MGDRQDERGHRLIRISREMLIELLKDRPAVATNLPSDTKLEELWHHRNGFGYVLRVSSKRWQPLVEGERVPVHEIEVEEYGYPNNLPDAKWDLGD